MRATRLIAAAAVLAAAVAAAGPVPARSRSRAAGPPVVVELFTAQGCASCPDADAMMADLAGRKDLIALTFSVDYWDYLGTKDSFAQPAFTFRQQAYVDRLKVREMYTPEAVVDGAAEGPAEPDRVAALIDKAQRARRSGPRLTVLRHGVRVGPGGADGRTADVWLVRYDPRPLRTKVKGDDGKTRSVVETDVVRGLARLGGWRGGARDFPIPPATDDLKTVVLVQLPHGGRILAAARVG